MTSFLAGLPPCPETLKPLQHYLKLAKELEVREPVVAYWARYQGVQYGIVLDGKSSDGKKFLMAIMDLLEKTKKSMPDSDAIRTPMVAQAYIEEFAIKLFKWADDQDRSGIQNANVVKAFYQATVLFDILEGIAKDQKESLSEDSERLRKYARWKATYIQKCLRSGEKPISGPIDEQGNPMPTIGTYNSNSSLNKPAAGVAGGGGGGGNSNIGFKPQPQPRTHQPGGGPVDSNNYPDLNNRNSSTSGGAGSTPPPPPRAQQQQQPRDNNNIVNPNSMYPMYPPPPSANNINSAASNLANNSNVPPPASPGYTSAGGAAAASSASGVPAELMNKVQKMVKYAGSSLTYDDVPSAVNFLEKALFMLKTGRDIVE